MEGRAKALLSFSVPSFRHSQVAAPFFLSRQLPRFGKSTARHRGVQWLLTDMAAEIHAARLMIYHAACMLDEGRRITRYAATAKLFATHMANRVADRAVQVHSGMGYVRELPVERYYHDPGLVRIVEGTGEIQKIIIGRGLMIKRYGEEPA